MKWTDFERAFQVEKTVFDLTCQSLDLIAQSPLGGETFHCFAFNVGAADGSILLSLATQADRREQNLYPPDWDYEVVQGDVPEITSLWRKGYTEIQTAYVKQVDQFGHDYDALDAFEEGFLHGSTPFESLKMLRARLWLL